MGTARNLSNQENGCVVAVAVADATSGRYRARMKVAKQCPKCMGRKLWHIEGIETGPYSSTGGQVLKLAARRRTPPVRESNWLTGDGSELYDAGQVDAFVCAGCGYTEFWSHDFEKLTHNPASGVHFIDG